MTAVDECFCEVHLSSLVEIARQRCEYSIEHALAFPFLKATKARRVWRIATGHVCPRSSSTQHPKDAVQYIARIAPRPAAFRRRSLPLRPRNEPLDRFPLLVFEV